MGRALDRTTLGMRTPRETSRESTGWPRAAERVAFAAHARRDGARVMTLQARESARARARRRRARSVGGQGHPSGNTRSRGSRSCRAVRRTAGDRGGQGNQRRSAAVVVESPTPRKRRDSRRRAHVSDGVRRDPDIMGAAPRRRRVRAGAPASRSRHGPVEITGFRDAYSREKT